MRILLLGAHGQLGQALARVLPTDTLMWGRGELDLAQPEFIAAKVRDVKPDIVINTAAVTDVDACERERDRARAIHADAPGELAQVCRELDCLLVHISTDYVFGQDENRRRPYIESDEPAAVNYYGETKLRGEQAVRASGCEFLIVRPSHVYGGKNAPSSYVERVLNRASEQNVLQATSDQIYSPTWVAELAQGLWRLIQEGKRGIIHLVNVGETSRYEFTKAIITSAGLKLPVQEARRQDFPASAPRPSYTALDSERIDLREYMSDWRTALEKYLELRSSMPA